MSEKKKIGSIKRFGARYGIKTKSKYGVIETEQRKKHKCPYCLTINAKRVALGIWLCKKCKSKFTGKAYSIKKKISFKEVEENETVEDKEESKENETIEDDEPEEKETVEDKEESKENETIEDKEEPKEKEKN